MNLTQIALVGVGGGLGSVLRWLIGIIVGEQYSGNFPAATFLINISGAFAIGFLSVYFFYGPQLQYAKLVDSIVFTGFLAGYTTFSTMQLDAHRLANNKARGLALFYLIISVVVGLLAAWAGVEIAKSFF